MSALTIAQLVDTSTFPPANDSGVLADLTGRRITGARVVLEWIARAWLTPAGSLTWAPNRGTDIRRLIQSSKTPAQLEAWRQRLAAEARKIDFVADCAVALTLAGGRLTIAARVVLTEGGTYPLEVSLDEAGKVLKVAA